MKSSTFLKITLIVLLVVIVIRPAYKMPRALRWAKLTYKEGFDGSIKILIESLSRGERIDESNSPSRAGAAGFVIGYIAGTIGDCFLEEDCEDEEFYRMTISTCVVITLIIFFVWFCVWGWKIFSFDEQDSEG